LRSGEIVESEMHHVMLSCAACGRTLADHAAWKGSGERYYCNEFCGDAEAADASRGRAYANAGARAPLSRPRLGRNDPLRPGNDT